MSSRTFSHLPDHHEAPRPSLTADPRIDDVARWWPFRSRATDPRTPGDDLPVLGLAAEASWVLLAPASCRAQPGQSELPVVWGDC